MKTQLDAKAEELAQALTDITRVEKDLEHQQRLRAPRRPRASAQKDGEIQLLKSQLKDKDTELKSYLERAVAAEKKLEFLKEDVAASNAVQGLTVALSRIWRRRSGHTFSAKWLLSIAACAAVPAFKIAVSGTRISFISGVRFQAMPRTRILAPRVQFPRCGLCLFLPFNE